jgi:transposase
MGRRSRAKEQRLNNCNRARLAKAEKATMPIPSPDESPLGHPARESSSNLECPAVGPATRSAIGPRGGTSRWTAWRARRPKKKPQYPSHNEVRYESRVLKLQEARIRQCCARAILSSQPDFAAQKSRLEDVIEKAGHLVLFYPKFHCELNWIEHYWGETKRYTRRNCTYTLAGLREVLPTALESVPDTLVWKHWNRVQRIIQVCRLRLELTGTDIN